MNGVYLRALPPDEYADVLVAYLGPGWDEQKVRKIAPLVQVKLKRLGEFPLYANFYFKDDVEPEDPSLLDRHILRRAIESLRGLESWDTPAIEAALRNLAEELGVKPGQAFQPIRMAVTGSKISPGLFESVELLGREETLRRLTSAVEGA
jgi:glutamyl-tRNA synthetase